MNRQVVVTGVGAVCCLAPRAKELWDCLSSGPPDGDFGVSKFELEGAGTKRELRRLDLFSQIALAATYEAMQDAGLTPGYWDHGGGQEEQVGVFLGSGGGGVRTMLREIICSHEHGYVSAFAAGAGIANAAGANIAIKYGLHGPNETIVTACAAGTNALVTAWQSILSGRCDMAIAGGSEAALLPFMSQGFANAGALSPTNNSRPFAVNRDGFALSEAAAILILESEEHAAARGSRILARISGGWVNCDAYHISAPSPGGIWAYKCMKKALSVSNVDLEDISWINAHGTGTALNDAAELQAIAMLYGDKSLPPISSIKGSTGHSIGAAGALEAVVTVESFRKQSIPPTVTDDLDPEFRDFDIVVEERPSVHGPVLSNSFGFGGHNAAIVIAPPDWK